MCQLGYYRAGVQSLLFQVNLTLRVWLSWLYCPPPIFTYEICSSSCPYHKSKFTSFLPSYNVLTNVLTVEVLIALPQHMQAFIPYQRNRKKSKADLLLFLHSCSFFSSLCHNKCFLHLFPVFTVNAQCFCVKEEPVRRSRFPQLLWPPGALHCPISLNFTFINFSTIVAKLLAVFAYFYYSLVCTCIILPCIFPHSWGISCYATTSSFKKGHEFGVSLIFIVKVRETLFPETLCLYLGVHQKSGQ